MQIHSGSPVPVAGGGPRTAAREQVVKDAGDDQADDPRDIHAAQPFDHRPRIELGRDEGHLHQHAEGVDEDAGHVPATVAPVRIRQRRDVILAAVHEVVVHQVHRAPGHEKRQQEKDERLERVQERMLADQRHGRRRRHDQHHGHRPLPVRDLHLAPEAAGDRGDAHEAAVGIQRGDRDLAEGDAEVQQRRHRAGAAQAYDVGDFAPRELAGGHGGGQHPQHHRDLRAHHRPQPHCQERLRGRRGAGQIARVVRHVRAIGDLPRRRQRHRQQERAPAEVPDLQQLAHVAHRHHAAEQPNRVAAMITAAKIRMPVVSLTPNSWPSAWPDSTVPVAVKPRYIRHTSTMGIAAP
ncbi:hypothetical protein G6F22_014169 [Rhizopus arrhizus]|nr:hypothetical protein G6F22_014169 [Rhizopus arrhizus]